MLWLTHVLRLPLYAEKGESDKPGFFCEMKIKKWIFFSSSLLFLADDSSFQCYSYKLSTSSFPFEAWILKNFFANSGSWPVSKAALTQVLLELIAV